MHKSSKPKKPRPDFPLFPHATGRWAKKVRQKLVYFGKISDDPDGQKALNLWLTQKDYLLAGRRPPNPDEYLVVGDLCNRFLTAKRDLVESGEMTARTWGDYYSACESIVAEFGRERAVEDLTPEDFAALRKRLAKSNGPVRLGNEIQRVRSLFKWAYEVELVERPVRTGPDFRKPPKHVVRKARVDRGPKMFEPEEIRTMLEVASTPLKAMILLGVNCGLGNSDCGSLRKRNLDLQKGWLNYPRPKTGVPRKCPLWPETVEALKAALLARPKPIDKSLKDHVFLTIKRVPWTQDARLKKEGGVGPRVDAVTQAFRRLLNELGIHRTGLGFYTLRHVFETVAGETTDQAAVDLIMGHADHSMAAIYREHISDARLRAVTDRVRNWLFSTSQNGE